MDNLSYKGSTIPTYEYVTLSSYGISLLNKGKKINNIHNKLVESLQINKLNKLEKKFDYYYTKYIEIETKIEKILNDIKIENISIEKNTFADEIRIIVKYTCTLKYYNKNIEKYIKIEPEYIKNFIRCKLVFIKVINNNFLISYGFEYYAGENKFLDKIKKIEKTITANKELLSLINERNSYAEKNNRCLYMIKNLQSNNKDILYQIKKYEYISKLSVGVIFTLGKKYKITKIEVKNERIYFKSLDSTKECLSFDTLYNNKKDIIFDIQSSRLIKFNNIKNVL